MGKDDLWKLHLTIAPPVKMPKPLSKKEKLYFWWADVKFFIEKSKDIAIILLKAYITATAIYALSYMTVHYLRQVLPG